MVAEIKVWDDGEVGDIIFDGQHYISISPSRILEFGKEEVEDYINTIGVRTFTNEDVEYVKLLNEATEILVKVRNFEIENGLAEYSTKAQHVIPSLINGVEPLFVACGLSTDAKQGVINLQYIISNAHRIVVDQ